MFTTTLSSAINGLLLGLAIINSRLGASGSHQKLQHISSMRRFGTEESGIGIVVPLEVELHRKETEKDRSEATLP